MVGKGVEYAQGLCQALSATAPGETDPLQTSTGALSVDPDTERQAKISGRCQSGDDGGDGGDG